MVEARAKLTYAGRIWRKEWKTKSSTSIKSKKAKERPSEVGVPLGMEEGTQKQEIQNKKVVRRLLGKKFSPCLENTTCRVGKASRRSQREKKRWRSSKAW